MAQDTHRTGLDAWDEIRTAYQVARLGTVSGAADVLGVHHATVIRHIDSLEKRLGSKLFQRHARGYTATEAGMDLLQVATATDEQFTQLASRIRGQGEGVTGELIVTSLSILSQLLTPIIADFQREHPGLLVRFLTDKRIFRLEYGEAHVAIRAGSAPDEPDNVVQPFMRLRQGLFASKGYAERHGLPSGESDLSAHVFVGDDGEVSRAPFFQWLSKNVPAERITWRATEAEAMHDAVRAGAGLGFVPAYLGARDPDLVEALPARDDWTSQLWLVTHVDLHRTAKVQAFLTYLKDVAKSWGEV